MANGRVRHQVCAKANGSVSSAVGVLVNIFATFFIAAPATYAWSKPCFDDENLSQLDLQQRQGALVYVWSPRMVLSAQHAASAQRQAQGHGLRFVPVHDAGVPQAELQAAQQRLLEGGVRGAASADHRTRRPSANGAPSASSTPGSSYKPSPSDKPSPDKARPMQHLAYPDSASALATSQPLCSASLLERDALRHFPTAFVVQPSGVHRYPIIGAMPEAAWAISIAQRLSPGVPVQAAPKAWPWIDVAIGATAGPSGRAVRSEVAP